MMAQKRGDRQILYCVYRQEGGVLVASNLSKATFNTWGVYLCVNLSRTQALKGITLCCYNKIR